MSEFDAARAARILSALREERPTVNAIVSAAAAALAANALLAVGASPTMARAEQETAESTARIGALNVNIGSLTPAALAGMRAAIAAARAAQVPWTLDPVGAGAAVYRTDAARGLAALGPAVVRGNAGEVLALAGRGGGAIRGVDAIVGSEAALEAARDLARSTGAAIAVTGAVDYVVDGTRTIALANGHPTMTRIAGLGCAATALIAAALAVERDRTAAAAAALAWLGVAGEIAAADRPGPGTLQARILDSLYTLDAPTLVARLRIVA